MENLFNLEEHTLCQKFKLDSFIGFKYHELKEDFRKSCKDIQNNHIILLQKGFLKISCNGFLDQYLKTAECILIPKNAQMEIEVIQPSEILILSFDILSSICDKQTLEKYKPLYEKTSYNFDVTPIRYPINNFIDQMIYYLKSGLNSEHLHIIKEKEFFLLLKAYYTEEEIVGLLHPILGESDFKSFILENYLKVDNVTDLARLSGMCRTAFDYKFKDVFGISPRQWMLKQIAQQVKYKAMDPEITILELMNHFRFNSATHFNRFCRQQFNCTPGELIRRQQSK